MDWWGWLVIALLPLVVFFYYWVVFGGGREWGRSIDEKVGLKNNKRRGIFVAVLGAVVLIFTIARGGLGSAWDAAEIRGLLAGGFALIVGVVVAARGD